jgi:Phosphotransferase enzyme family
VQSDAADGQNFLNALGVSSEEHLLQLVGRSLGRQPVEIADLTVSEVPYDQLALTTLSRSRVRGTAMSDGLAAAFSIFVKVLQSWSRSPIFELVPLELRELALAQLPWTVEPLAYRSALRDALPPGLTMPKTFEVIDLDPLSSAIWIEDIDDVVSLAWTMEHYRLAAFLLGSFATRAEVAEAIRPLDPVIEPAGIPGYVHGRLASQVVPALLDEEVWRHPLVDRYFASHRPRLLKLVDQLQELVDEVESLPAGIAHGDACNRNLMISASRPDLVMIDFGFLRHAPLGLDLGQLILGEVQTGERPAADLESEWSACLSAFVEGTRNEGSQIELAKVARASSICMAIFNGITAIPFEYLGQPPNAHLEALCQNRARMCRFTLDRLDATS